MTKKMILIVEDNPDHRLWLELVMKPIYTVLSAGTGREAQALFQEHSQSIDCLVLDIRLPDMTAFELLNSFEKMCFPGIPATIIQTEFDDQQWMQTLFGDYRALHYLVKPFDAADIIRDTEHAIDANPYRYKSAQIEERMAVMSALNGIRQLMYHQATQLPQDEQTHWMPEIMDLFQLYGIKSGEFPSGSRDDFKLTASLEPIFDLIHRFYGIPIPKMSDVRVGVCTKRSDQIQGILNDPANPIDGAKMTIVSTDTPTSDHNLDFWICEFSAQTLGHWQEIASMFLPYQNTAPIHGIAILNKTDQPLMATAIELGVPYVVIETDSFAPTFCSELARFSRRRYEVRTIQELSVSIRAF